MKIRWSVEVPVEGMAMECFLQFIERPFLLPVESRFSYAGSVFSSSLVLSPAATTSNSHSLYIKLLAPVNVAPPKFRIGEMKNFVSSGSELKSASSAG